MAWALWLTRKVLAGLLWLALAISSYQTRQLELDADRYVVRLVGLPVFTSLLEGLELLSLAHQQQSLSNLEECWSEGRLADNLPWLTLANRRSLDDELVAAVREEVANCQARRCDTHPAAAEPLVPEEGVEPTRP